MEIMCLKILWVLDTVGTNLKEILAIDYIDTKRTYSNDIQEVYKTLGIEAARQCIYNELVEAFSDITYINYHHMSMLCDRMCATKKMVSIFNLESITTISVLLQKLHLKKHLKCS